MDESQFFRKIQKMTEQENHIYQDLQDLYFKTHSKTEKVKNKFKIAIPPMVEKVYPPSQKLIE